MFFDRKAYFLIVSVNIYKYEVFCLTNNTIYEYAVSWFDMTESNIGKL